MPSIDQQTRRISHREDAAVGAVIRKEPIGGPSTGEVQTVLGCPYSGCECYGHTHIVDVVWECDPFEGDRRWVRLEVRCEQGRGYFLLIRNHAGKSRLEYKRIESKVSPFEEGVRW